MAFLFIQQIIFGVIQCILWVGGGGWIPGGTVVKNPPAKGGDTGSIPGSERSIGGGNGNLLQYSCLENPMDRGAWRSPTFHLAHGALGLALRTQLLGQAAPTSSPGFCARMLAHSLP